MTTCHIAPQAEAGTACPCEGEATVMLVVKHHHIGGADGGCEETTVSMCPHHYGHYLQGIAQYVLAAVITGDRTCRRCGKAFADAKDIFERVSL